MTWQLLLEIFYNSHSSASSCACWPDLYKSAGTQWRHVADVSKNNLIWIGAVQLPDYSSNKCILCSVQLILCMKAHIDLKYIGKKHILSMSEHSTASTHPVTARKHKALAVDHNHDGLLCSTTILHTCSSIDH
jgi:hypothetical protein